MDSVDGIFDQVANHFQAKWDDPKDKTNNEDGASDEDFFGDGETKETDEGTPEKGTEKPGEEKPPRTDDETSFKPYTFKATIDGKEVEKTFKSAEELNGALAKAEIAPRLWQESKRLRSEMETLKPDAEFAQDLIETAKQEPLEFLKLIESDFISPEVLSGWVYDKYHEFAKVANMSPEQQAAWAMQKEAEKIIEENRYRRQLDAEAQREQQQRQEQEESRQFHSWASKEQTRWKKDIPSEYHGNVDMAMKTVVAYARRQLDVGEQVSFKRMTGMVKTLLEPYKRSMSPAQREREVADAVRRKKEQATSSVQRAVRGASSHRNDANPGRMAYTAEDIFDGAIAGLKSGRNKWRDE